MDVEMEADAAGGDDFVAAVNFDEDGAAAGFAVGEDFVAAVLDSVAAGLKSEAMDAL